MTSPVGSASSTQGSLSAASTTTGAGGKMGKDEFAKLLIAQMTHQDPMNPMDGTQMAAQLAQFSSVEQLMNIGAQLDTQSGDSASLLQAMDRTAALGMIGRSVTAISDEISVANHTAGTVQVEMPGAGGKVRAHILDSSGREVGMVEYPAVPGGRQSLDLAGALQSVPNGNFRVKLEMIDANEAPTGLMPIQQFAIDGLRFGTNGAILTSGRRSVPIGNVIGVASN